jgi:hypothetical protein
MLLLISPKYGTKPDAVALIKAARARGIEVETLLNSWSYAKQKATFGKTDGAAIAPYGEHAFCEFIAQELRLNLFQNSLDWVSRIPDQLTKRTVKHMTLAEAIDIESNRNSIINKQVLEPADEPIFSTGIYDQRFPRVPEDTQIIVHEAVDWLVKYRFIIVNNKIESYCCYRVSHIFNEPSIWQNKFTGSNTTSDAFVRTVLNHCKVAPACVLDVGYIKNTGWSVCNTYPIWSSELYGCDADALLKGIFVACKRV